MTGTIVNDLSGLFRSQALGEAAAQLGESESSVMRGFEAASSAIVGALTTHLGQSGFLKQAYELASSPLNDGGMLSDIRGLFSKGTAATPSDGLGGRMLSMLFGGNTSNIAQGISESSGLRVSSAATLMAAAAPMVLGLLGRRVKESHLDVSGFSTILQNEGAIVTRTPEGEITTGALPEETKSSRWVVPLLLAVVAAIVLFWLLSRGRNVVDQATDAAGTAVANLGDFYQRTLPNGISLNIPRFGVESRLADFIQNSSLPVDNTWFDFDRLSFDTNSATLRPESTEQLSNIANILKAYPTVHVKIGGYTDNSGDAAANMQLSQARANSVMQQLTGMGVEAERLEAQGYGDTVPVADNSTDAGRFKNRRVALRLTSR